MKKEKRTGNLVYLTYFLIVFFVLASVSLLIKGINLYRNAGFKSNSFNILVINKDASIVHLQNRPKTLSIVNLEGEGSRYRDKGRLELSLLLKVPIDGKIKLESGNQENIDKGFFGFSKLLKLLSSKREKINEYDLIKLSFLAKKIKKSESFIKNIKNYDDPQVEHILPEMFNENDIINDKTSIQIINATGIDGVGGRATEFLRNAGFNVVSVETGKEGSSKIIYRVGEGNVSFKRLKGIFGFSAEKKEETTIADITVIIGK